MTESTQSDNPLDRLVASDAKRAIAMLLWKNRHANPELNVQITEQDIKGFDDCVEYLDVDPEVRIFRPAGRPAEPPREALPPTKANPNGVPAFPGRAGDPPRNFVLVGLYVAGTTDSFKPIENNEADKDKADRAEALRRAKESANFIANQVRNDALAGTFSASSVVDVCDALLLLAKS